VCHLDEAGFALTLPTAYTWFPKGERLCVSYHAAQGHRVHAIGAYFTHGPAAGRLAYQSWACLPKRRAKKPRTTPEERTAAHGLAPDEVGPIDAARFLAFAWQIAGRERAAPATWKRERPLVIVLDNYSIHKSRAVEDARPLLVAADIHLVYLPAYCPELSAIEPVWNDVKHHQLSTRSFERVVDLKHAVDDALAHKAHQLRQQHAESTILQRLVT
jgi:hypothetical protein